MYTFTTSMWECRKRRWQWLDRIFFLHALQVCLHVGVYINRCLTFTECRWSFALGRTELRGIQAPMFLGVWHPQDSVRPTMECCVPLFWRKVTLQKFEVVSHYLHSWHTVELHDFLLNVCELFSSAFICLQQTNLHEELFNGYTALSFHTLHYFYQYNEKEPRFLL